MRVEYPEIFGVFVCAEVVWWVLFFDEGGEALFGELTTSIAGIVKAVQILKISEFKVINRILGR
jgi:hypothetical protein